jgi:hypothetical protein
MSDPVATFFSNVRSKEVVVRAQTSHEIDDLLATLIEDSIRRDIPRAVAENAARATRSALRLAPGPITAQSRRRVEAYFAAVVRRRVVVRRRESPRAAARFVVASIVEDLRSAGRDGADIWEELKRGWGERVPVDILEEYRLRLCG